MVVAVEWDRETRLGMAGHRGGIRGGGGGEGEEGWGMSGGGGRRWEAVGRRRGGGGGSGASCDMRWWEDKSGIFLWA